MIAGEHDDAADAESSEFFDHASRLVAFAVGDGDETQDPIVVADADGGLTPVGQPLQVAAPGLELLVEKLGPPDSVDGPVQPGDGALAGNGFEVADLEFDIGTILGGPAAYGPGDGVLGARLDGRRDRQQLALADPGGLG